MSELIELNKSSNSNGNATEWMEELDKEDQNRRQWPHFAKHKVPVSACGRFAFILSPAKSQLQVIDNFNGISTKLRFAENTQINFTDKKFSPYSNCAKSFYPTSNFHEGVLFWTNYLMNRNREPIGFVFYAAKVELDFDKETFMQISHTLEIKPQIDQTWSSQLVPEQSIVLITGRKDLDENRGPRFFTYEIQQFSLTQMKFYGPKVTYGSDETILMKQMTTFYNGRFYDFEFTQRDLEHQAWERKAFVAERFASINCYDPKENAQQKIQLENDLNCLGIEGDVEKDRVQCDGMWSNNLLYFHAIKLTQHRCLPVYHHYFAVLNLDTLRWRQISFNFNSGQTSTSLPMAMSIGDGNQMMLVKSMNVLNFQAERYGLNNLPLYDGFINAGGHIHCSSQRVALRRPDSLNIIMLQSMNKMNPRWKSTETGKSLVKFIEHKPLTGNKALQPNPKPFACNLTGIHTCKECSPDNFSTPSQKYLLLFLQYFDLVIRFFKTSPKVRFFTKAFLYWLFLHALPMYFEVSSMDDQLYEKFIKIFECRGEWHPVCLISYATGINGFTALCVWVLLMEFLKALLMFSYPVVFYTLCFFGMFSLSVVSFLYFCYLWFSYVLKR